MRHPVLGSVVNVTDSSVEKFTSLGYVAAETKPSPAASQAKSSTKKSASSKSSK